MATSNDHSKLAFSFTRQIISLASCCLATALFLGCGSGSDQTTVSPDRLPEEWVAQRDRFWSEQPLTGEIVTPTDIKDGSLDPSLPPGLEPEPESESESDATTLIAGRIDVGDVDPFSTTEASFMMSQLPDEDHTADDPEHADNCPFCKRKLANAPKAMVKFQDEAGTPLSVPASQLFGLRKGDIVVVQGRTHFDDSLNTVMVEASKIFRRP